MFPRELETDRLLLERLSHETIDLESYYRACSVHEPGIEGVVEYVPGFEPHRHPKETRDFVDRAERQWDDGERAEYIVWPREGEPGAGNIAGGTRLDVDWDKRTADLGIWLRTEFWGRGYAGERARAFLEVAFERLDLELVQAVCLDGNERSRRAIEKYVAEFGGTYEGRLRNWMVDSDGAPVDCHRYTISADEYLEHR